MRYLLFLLTLLSGISMAQLNIQQWYTPEGAKVLFVKTQGLPILDVSLSFDAAASRDGDKPGLAHLTSALIGSATHYRSEEEIIQAFESVGAEFSTNSLKDMSMVSLRTLTREALMRRALDTFVEVVSKPKFEAQHFYRERKQTLRAIVANQQSPAKVASLAFDKLVFDNHPYAQPRLGNIDSLSKIRLADIQAHYQRYYVANNLNIAIVGDVSTAKAKQVARQISHGLNTGKKANDNPRVKPLVSAINQHIEFPSKQTHLLIGQTGINRSHPDYHALYLGNHLLGGSGLNSLLSQQVREARGLSYSISSYFTKMRSNGYFKASLQTKNAQAAQAKTVVLKTLDRFLNQPIDHEQLQDAKDNIIGGFALEIASNANILTYLSIIGFYDLPLDYLSSFIDKIEDLSAEQVQGAFRRLIDLDRLVILSVGDTMSR